jgi:hypothetical protein
MKKLIVALIFLLATSANATGILVSWNANTETDLAGYVIDYAAPGDAGWVLANGQYTYTGAFTHQATVGLVTSWTLNPAAPGPYAVNVSAKDTANNISLPSDAVVKLVPAPVVPPVIPPIDVPPGKVLTVTITIQ